MENRTPDPQIILPAQPLGYASAEAKTPRVWASIGILLGGIGVLVIGGCFLIGVMVSLNVGGINGYGNVGHVRTTLELVFIGVLSALSFVSLATGAWILFIGIRALLRIANG